MQTPATYPVTINQSDIDMTLRASISTVIGIILRIAGVDAEAKGFGIDAINQENHTWVLSRFALEINHLPTLHEEFGITTWIGEYNRLISTRNFVLTSTSGVDIGGAISQWCMLDLASRRAIDLSTLHRNYLHHVLREYKSTISAVKKVPTITEPTSTSTHRVTYSDIDFNGHLNSLRYIDLMLDTLPIELLRLNRPLRIDMQFMHECYIGDNLTINYLQQGDAAIFEILQSDTTPALKCIIEWR